MNKNIINFVVKQLRDVANKIEKGDCELTDEDAGVILSTISHTPMSKEQDCKYINLQRSRFDDLVREGRIPKGRKTLGRTGLTWFKDELDLAIRK